MGNDTRFVEAEDLPFRLIDVPIGSAPPPPSPPPIRQSHTQNKRHTPPIPPPRVEGYDAPPSLRPPPVIPKRFDQPVIHPPPRSDLPQSSYSKNINSQISSKKIKYHRRRIPKPKLACCVIC
jgi:hypothetical protein